MLLNPLKRQNPPLQAAIAEYAFPTQLNLTNRTLE